MMAHSTLYNQRHEYFLVHSLNRISAMFTLPSIWTIIISTLVFVIAAWYLHRLLDEHGMPKGLTRSLQVFVMAYVVSWASGALVDWSRERIYGPEPVSQNQKDLNQALDVLKANGISFPN